MEGQKYKDRFSARTEDGDFLGLTVWPGKKDPSAEVLTVQLRRQSNGEWKTVGKLAVYRGSDGKYSLLPDRDSQAPRPGAPTPPQEPASQ